MWIFEKLTTHFEHLTSKQDTEFGSMISDDFALEVLFLGYDVMGTLWYIINNNNNALCWTVNAQIFETIDHNTI